MKRYSKKAATFVGVLTIKGSQGRQIGYVVYDEELQNYSVNYASDAITKAYRFPDSHTTMTVIQGLLFDTENIIRASAEQLTGKY